MSKGSHNHLLGVLGEGATVEEKENGEVTLTAEQSTALETQLSAQAENQKQLSDENAQLKEQIKNLQKKPATSSKPATPASNADGEDDEETKVEKAAAEMYESVAQFIN